ncbi:hypothetical protein [Halorubrum aethiopicum]|uniref:hypothetical protein n=1 Tax=Halorubrum aethiopicum TaxID=1758255 RepID=UPI000A5470DD|nr:hypothetical protein [Halorubrum aethiopicum]
MSQHVEKIRDLLNHEHFDNVSEFSEIAAEENYTTEHGGITLNEAIADFEHISELLEIAIENDIISVFGRGQQSNIKDRLNSVRQEAGNIVNKNDGRRNNPGKDFINRVDKLQTYVIGDLSLDLRVGEHLDFSEQLHKLEQTREEHQKAIQNLGEAEETHEKINSIHDDISEQQDEIDRIVSSAKESQGSLEEIENKASNTSQDIKKEADTINDRYEKVLKKTEQMNDYEDRLDSNLSEIEDRSEQLSQQKSSLDDIEDRIDTLLSGAIAASLDRNFTERKEELENSATRWARLTFGAIIALIAGAIVIFWSLLESTSLGIGTVSRVTLLIPLLVGVWFTSKNYSRKRRLMEEYAFKSTMAQTLEPSRKVLESQQSLDETDAQLAEFMLVSMGQMFTNPSDIVENGSTTTNDEDATNIETVMDLAKRIAKSE